MPLAIFDLDNTLIDRTGPLRRWAEQWVATHHLDPAEVQWLIAADGDGFVQREVFLAAVRERYGLIASLDTLLGLFREQIVDLVEPDPVATDTLDTLRAAGWTVAIATNGETAQQMAKIRRTGLDAHTDAVAVSAEVGAAKPDARIFETVARRCGAQLSNGGWMVGDSESADIAGGQGVGLRTIWMRRGRSWDSAEQPPDAVADDISETVSIMVADQRP